MKLRSLLALGALAGLAGCATVAALVQPPRFQIAPGRSAELRLLAPSPQRPIGGAAVRIWTRVENPNPFGLRIASLDGNLFVEGTRAGAFEFPLGLPLAAKQDTVLPLDFSLSFADLPGLADVVMRAVTGRTLAYRLDGTVAVDAGPLGRPSFGPTTLLQGELEVRR